MNELTALASRLVARMNAAGLQVATAESCTGGWIAKALTDVPGSSGCFAYGLVSYSNEAKQSLLGVSGETLEQFGAVSEQVVREMVQGALKLSGADIAVAVSGIAGPDGGSVDKPVGTVWFAWATRSGEAQVKRCLFDGDRKAVRAATVALALEKLLDLLESRGD